MAAITIEGSLTHCTLLERGERRRVNDDDPEVQMLLRGGFAVIVDEESGEAPVITEIPEQVKAPARNASRDDWAEFLAKYTSVVTDGKDRGELLSDFDEWLLVNELPSVEVPPAQED